MNQRKRIYRIILAAAGLASLTSLLEAAPFTYTQGDLCLGFRKTGGNAGTHEAVVNIGSVTNFINLAAGASTSVGNYSTSQIKPDSFADFNNLQWSVTAYTVSASFGGFPKSTLWLTVPRPSVGTQTTPPFRLSQSGQQSCATLILSIFGGASDISSRLSAGQDNTTTFVQEPNNTGNIAQGEYYGNWMGMGIDPTKGTLQDNWLQNNLENVTPASFTSPVRSDLYECLPDANSTTDPALYLGYFQLNTDGTMSFTRASASSPTPPAPALAIARLGNTSYISFATTNGATYKLYYTNSAGLHVATSNWPSPAGTITGNGLTNSFMDTTTDAARFYRVSAH